MQTKSQIVAADVAALIRARNPLLWIVTREETRVEGYLMEAAAKAGYMGRTWDVAQGFARMGGITETDQDLRNANDPGAALSAIDARSKEFADKEERCAWIMRDLPVWLTGPAGAAPCRQLRNMAKAFPGVARDQAQALLIITPSRDIPPELAGHTTVIEWPLPDREEIASILDNCIAGLPEEMQKDAAPNGTRDAAIDAAVGLSGEEAQNCYARSIVQKRSIDPALVAGEKRRIIAREKVMEWFDPLPGGLDAVGGLEVLKGWLTMRKSAYSQKARDYGLPSPKGAMLIGIPGCGKSLVSKAISTAWGVPLLRVDLGALKSKFVGESEQNLRKAFDVIAAIGRCVVWFDEIEKALSGATQGAADGGVSSDALGAMLSWMQERQGEAFVIATANDASALPPELLRKGRFDELWFVDLPSQGEREAILRAALKQHGRADVAIDITTVATKCDQFTGAEIAAIVPEGLFTAFNDECREIATADLLQAAASVKPMATLQAEKIKKLREFAGTNCRNASAAADAVARKATTGRQIDV